MMDGHWVSSWAAMPQPTGAADLLPEPFTMGTTVLADATLRQTIHTSVGGRQVRLRFSNVFGGTALSITAVTVALPVGGAAGVSAVRPGTVVPVLFHGRTSIVVPAGAQVVSDPLSYELTAQANLTVTMYLARGQASGGVTSHPGSRTTSYAMMGNQVSAADLAAPTAVDHWYFLGGLEVWAPRSTAAVAMLGDSLTDGRSSTTNGNDRWPDRLLARLQADPETAGIAVINQAGGGNRVLNDGIGPNALSRLDRDVLAQSGVAWLVVFEGVNDLGTAEATGSAQAVVAADLITAFDQIVIRAHARGIRVYGATITPFGGHSDYDDPTGHREAARQTVNRWIRTSERFDAVLDFDQAIRDPANPRQLLAQLHDGDRLHLNPAGYQAIADAVPARLFAAAPLPGGFGFN